MRRRGCCACCDIYAHASPVYKSTYYCFVFLWVIYCFIIIVSSYHWICMVDLDYYCVQADRGRRRPYCTRPVCVLVSAKLKCSFVVDGWTQHVPVFRHDLVGI